MDLGFYRVEKHLKQEERMKKIIPLLAAFFLIMGSSVRAEEFSPVLTTLENELKVITLEDHSAPIVTLMVWYRVGSRNEHTGVTGISHLLEHMLFKSTKNFKGGEIAKVIKRNGGYLNGFTGEDYTGYYETLASDRIEIALKIEADRMVNGILDPEEQRPEITVVKSELEGGENNPQYLLYREVKATSYLSHPYGWPVIGWKDDVLKIKREELYKYYKTYYQPNNATLVIVGDFTTPRMLALVEKYFGDIPKGPQPPEVGIREPEQRGERRVVVRREGNALYLLAAYHVPEIGHPDIFALDLLSQILSGGKSSRLYRRLVLGNWATEVEAYCDENVDPGLFTLWATVREGRDIEKVEEVIFKEIERVAEEGVTQKEMDRAWRQIEASYIFSRDSVSSQARKLGYYETIASYHYYLNYLENMKKVTLQDVGRVAKKYLTRDNRTVGWFIPTRPKGGKGPGPFRPKEAYYQGENPSFSLPTPDTMPKITREVLDNGLVVIILEDHSNQTVAIRGSLKAGGVLDPPELKGLSRGVAGMLERGTKDRSLLEIADTLESVGARISISSGVEAVNFSASSLSRDLASIIEVLADLLQNPRFPRREIKRLKGIYRTHLLQREDSPEERGSLKLYELLFPEGHPYHSPTIEERQRTIEKVKRKDLVRFHQEYYGGEKAIMVIVGDLDTEETLELIKNYFTHWRSKTGGREVDIPTVPLVPETREEIIPMMDKSQVSVHLGHTSFLTRDHPDYYAAQVANHILGGGWVSRLNNSLREKEGLVYYVYSRFRAGLGAGPWVASFGVNPKDTEKAINLLKYEMERMRREGVTQEEVDDAIKYITGSYPLRMETNWGLASALHWAEYYDLGLDYPWTFQRNYTSLTLEEVTKAVRRYLHPDALLTVISGPYQRK